MYINSINILYIIINTNINGKNNLKKRNRKNKKKKDSIFVNTY